MSREIASRDYETAAPLLQAGRSDEQIVAALQYRGLSAEDALAVLTELKKTDRGPVRPPLSSPVPTTKALPRYSRARAEYRKLLAAIACCWIGLLVIKMGIDGTLIKWVANAPYHVVSLRALIFYLFVPVLPFLAGGGLVILSYMVLQEAFPPRRAPLSRADRIRSWISTVFVALILIFTVSLALTHHFSWTHFLWVVPGLMLLDKAISTAIPSTRTPKTPGHCSQVRPAASPAAPHQIPPDLLQRITAKSDRELVRMLVYSGDWLPDALDVARSELARRGVDLTAAPTPGATAARPSRRALLDDDLILAENLLAAQRDDDQIAGALVSRGLAPDLAYTLIDGIKTRRVVRRLPDKS